MPRRKPSVAADPLSAPELTDEQQQRLGEVLTVLDREQPDSFVLLSRWCEGFQNADEFVLGRGAVWEPCFDGSVFLGRDFVSPVAPAFHQAFVGHLSRLGANDAAKSFPLTAPLHLKRQIPEKLCYVIGRARRLCNELETRAGGLSCDAEPVGIPCDESWESVRTLDEFKTWLKRRIVEVEQLLPKQRCQPGQALSLWTTYWQAREWLTRHGHENELPPLNEKLDDAYRWMQTRKGAAPDAMEALRVMHELLKVADVKPGRHDDKAAPASAPLADPKGKGTPVDDVAEMVKRVALMLGGGDAAKIMAVVTHGEFTTDQKLCALAKLDERFRGYKSKDLAELLGVSEASIRNGDVWREWNPVPTKRAKSAQK